MRANAHHAKITKTKTNINFTFQMACYMAMKHGCLCIYKIKMGTTCCNEPTVFENDILVTMETTAPGPSPVHCISPKSNNGKNSKVDRSSYTVFDIGVQYDERVCTLGSMTS
jgi:hypothetical protein